jgi:hypothetical protein
MATKKSLGAVSSLYLPLLLVVVAPRGSLRLSPVNVLRL